MSRRLSKRYLTEADDYECLLSVETQKLAEEELRETENSRTQALDSLRKWLEQNPKFMAIRMGKTICSYLLESGCSECEFFGCQTEWVKKYDIKSIDIGTRMYIYGCFYYMLPLRSSRYQAFFIVVHRVTVCHTLRLYT